MSAAALEDATLTEFLKSAAELAKAGVSTLVVLGKVTKKQAWPAKDGRAASVSCKTVVCEGDSWDLRFPDGSATPGLYHQGAFVVDPESVYKGKNGISVDVLEFA